MFLIMLEIKQITAIAISAVIALLIILIIVSSIRNKIKNNKEKSKVIQSKPSEEENTSTVAEFNQNDFDDESDSFETNVQPKEGEFIEDDEVFEQEQETADNLKNEVDESTEKVILEDEKKDEEISSNSSPLTSNTTTEVIDEMTSEDEEVLEETKANKKYTGKFEVFQEGSFYKYRLKASNGEVLVVSQMYKSKDSVYRSIESLKRNVTTGTVRIIKDKTDMFTFKLVAKNHRVMAISSHYPTEARAISASESFKRFALSAVTEDIVLELDERDFNSVLIEVDKSEDKEGGKYVIKKDEVLDWCWELIASNGQVLCKADGYTTKSGAQNSILNFKSNVMVGNFYVLKNKGGRFQFKLFSPQGRLVVLGESYPVKSSAESAASSVCAFYKKAVIDK